MPIRLSTQQSMSMFNPDGLVDDDGSPCTIVTYDITDGVGDQVELPLVVYVPSKNQLIRLTPTGQDQAGRQFLQSNEKKYFNLYPDTTGCYHNTLLEARNATSSSGSCLGTYSIDFHTKQVTKEA